MLWNAETLTGEISAIRMYKGGKTKRKSYGIYKIRMPEVDTDGILFGVLCKGFYGLYESGKTFKRGLDLDSRMMYDRCIPFGIHL